MAKKRIQQLRDEQEELLKKREGLQVEFDEMIGRLVEQNKIPLEKLDMKEIKSEKKAGAIHDLMKIMSEFLVSD